MKIIIHRSNIGYFILSLLLIGATGCATIRPSVVERSEAVEAKIFRNEHCIISMLKSISSALAVYAFEHDSYPKRLETLSTTKYLLDVNVTEYGYDLHYEPGDPNEKGLIKTYSLTARPLKAGVTGNRIFFVDQRHIIRLNNAQAVVVQ